MHGEIWLCLWKNNRLGGDISLIFSVVGCLLSWLFIGRSTKSWRWTRLRYCEVLPLSAPYPASASSLLPSFCFLSFFPTTYFFSCKSWCFSMLLMKLMTNEELILAFIVVSIGFKVPVLVRFLEAWRTLVFSWLF